MSNAEPPCTGGLDGTPSAAPPTLEPSLDDLMARVRQELTGTAKNPLGTELHGAQTQTFDTKVGDAPDRGVRELSLSEVMARMRIELKRRRGGSLEVSAGSSNSVPATEGLPRWQPSAARLPVQETYVLADLLRFSDSDFVENAFRILLRRPASVDEKAHYLTALRSGGVSKVEMLGNIRFSDEGMQDCVHVDGLLLPYKLHKWQRIPLLGWFLTMANTVFRLPRLLAHLQKMEAVSAQESQQVGSALNDLAQAVEDHQSRVQTQIDSLAGRDEVRALTVASNRLREQLAVQAEELAEARAKLEIRIEARLSGEVLALAAASSSLRDQLGAQASKLTQVVSADHEVRGAIELIETKLDEQASEQMKLESRLRAQLSDEIQTLATASSSLQDRLETQVSELARISLADHETRNVVSQIESKLAEQEAASARLEHRLGVEVTGEIQALMLVIEQLQERLAGQATALAQIKQSDGIAQQAVGAIEARLDHVAQFEAALKAQLESGLTDRVAAHAQLEQRLHGQMPVIAKLAESGAENRRAVRDIERRLMTFFDRVSQQAIASPAVAVSDTTAQEEAGLLDAHYVSFEDTFRGTREDIKARASQYLGTLSEAGIGNETGLILDIGCGRGEWLEVLAENGYTCRGVDLNSVMISEARGRGLDVVESDAVTYLRSLESEFASAITSMHLVEHLPYEVLIRLLDEAFRVLQPGGVLILETPNPENLTVGSYWFYMDPTHRNPIPPTLLQWVVQDRGFESAAIERLSKNRGVSGIQPVGDDVDGSSQINEIIRMLTIAPDYAIVARKPFPSGAKLEEA